MTWPQVVAFNGTIAFLVVAPALYKIVQEWYRVDYLNWKSRRNTMKIALWKSAEKHGQATITYNTPSPNAITFSGVGLNNNTPLDLMVGSTMILKYTFGGGYAFDVSFIRETPTTISIVRGNFTKPITQSAAEQIETGSVPNPAPPADPELVMKLKERKAASRWKL